jgi:putative membrane protein
MSLRQVRSSLTVFAGAVFAGVVLLSSSAAIAQVSPGGGAAAQQNPASPGGAGGIGQTTPGMPNDSVQQTNPNGNMQDKEFVHSALQGGMAEVQLGQLAAEKGSSNDVKQFGQRMVQDHTKLGDQMKPVAQQLGVSEPKSISKKDKQLMEKLQGLSGEQFDNAYIAAMVKDHKKDNEEFKSEISQTQNPQLRQVAQQGDQVIDSHLQMIEQIAKAHNVVNDKGKVVSGD